MELIQDVYVTSLKLIPDSRGRLMEILRADDPRFKKFGQVYMTTCYPGVVKGWHYHKLQTDNFAVVRGTIKLVLYDDREGSPTRKRVNEFFLGEHGPIRVEVPPLVHHGFMGVGTKEAVVINCVSECYNYADPDEYRTDPHNNDIPYDWKAIDR